MSLSSSFRLADKEKDEKITIPEALYEYLIDPSFFSNIEVDPYSQALLKPKIGQRYAVVGFLEGKIIRLYYRPSFLGKSSYESIEQKDKRIKKESKGFNIEDIVEAPPEQTGVVHQRTIRSVRDYALKYKTGEVLTNPIIGLSFFVDHFGILDWTARSTINFNAIKLNEVAESCYHFPENQHDFTRPKYLINYNGNRSLPQDLLDKIKFKLEKIEFKEGSISKLRERLDREKELLLQQRANSYSVELAKKWQALFSDPLEISNSLMRTIYFASGLQKNTHAYAPFQPPNSEVIEVALRTAKKYDIPLDLNKIPSEAEYNFGCTALIQSVFSKDIDSVAAILQYDKKNKHTINFPDDDDLTPVTMAASMGYYDILQVLIEHGAETQKELKEAFEQKKMEKIPVLMSQEKIILNARKKKQLYHKLHSVLKFSQYRGEESYTEALAIIKEFKENEFSFKEALIIPNLISNFFIFIFCDFRALKKTKELVSERGYREKILNAVNFLGNTPLMHLIVIAECFDVMVWLVNTENCDITKRNHNGDTPLMLAIALMEYDYELAFEVVKLLLAKNSTLIDDKDYASRSVLVKSLAYSDLSMFNLLLQKGAKDNPIEIAKGAAEYGHTALVLKLVQENKFNHDIKISLAEVALDNHHLAIADLLTEEKQEGSEESDPTLKMIIAAIEGKKWAVAVHYLLKSEKRRLPYDISAEVKIKLTETLLNSTASLDFETQLQRYDDIINMKNLFGVMLSKNQDGGIGLFALKNDCLDVIIKERKECERLHKDSLHHRSFQTTGF